MDGDGAAGFRLSLGSTIREYSTSPTARRCIGTLFSVNSGTAQGDRLHFWDGTNKN